MNKKTSVLTIISLMASNLSSVAVTARSRSRINRSSVFSRERDEKKLGLTGQLKNLPKKYDCQAGEYETIKGCKLCKDNSNFIKPENSYYVKGDHCPWNCNTGFVKQGSTCVIKTDDSTFTKEEKLETQKKMTALAKAVGDVKNYCTRLDDDMTEVYNLLFATSVVEGASTVISGAGLINNIAKDRLEDANKEKRETLEKDIKDLNGKLAIAGDEEKKKTLQKEITDLNKQLTEEKYEEKIATLEAEIETLKKQLEEEGGDEEKKLTLKTEIETLKGQIEKKETEIKKKEAEITKLEEQLKTGDYENKINKLQEDIDSFNKLLETEEDEGKKTLYQNQVTEKTTEKTRLENEKNQLNADIPAKKSEKQTLEGNKKELDEQVTAKNKELLELYGKIPLAEQIATKEKKKTELEEKKKYLEEKIAKKEQEVGLDKTTLQTEITNKEQEKQKLTDEEKRYKNVTTGLLATSTITGAVGLGTGGVAVYKLDKNIKNRTDDCRKKIGELKNKLSVITDKDKEIIGIIKKEDNNFIHNESLITGSKAIVDACDEFVSKDSQHQFTLAVNLAKSTVGLGTVGTATSLIGAITSAASGSDKKNNKDLNLTTSIMAGISTGTHGAATVTGSISAAKLDALKEAASKCQAALK